MKRLAALWLAGLPAALLAQSASPDAPGAQGDVAITIYSNDLALVQDKRMLALPSGLTRQDFRDVSSRIRPETVRLSVSDADIVEQNYDYDLLSPSALMDKAVGQTITIVRTNPATGAETRERAQVLAANEGVILKIGDRIEVLREDGLPVRVVFDSLPPNLRARPTLSVTLDSRRAGTRPATLSYLTGGFSWRADYVALFDEGKNTLDMQGWITLNNQGGTRFDNADVVLVAGQPGSGDEEQRYRPRPRGYAPGSTPGTESAGRERLGDYYLYPLGHRTALAANQQKQVSFLSVDGVPARKVYRYRNGWLGRADEAQSAATAYSFSSAKSGGLGDALPAGTVRLYVRDAKGAPQFIGENAIDHTPMGSVLSITTGEAFDVKVQPIVDKRERITSDVWEQSLRYRITTDGRTRDVRVDTPLVYWRTAMRYKLTNARDVPVTVEVVQAGLDNYWGDTRVPSESQPGTQRSRDERVWEVRVPANGTAELTAVFDTRY
ncbi:DUF4139 domain-containing protein [Sphingomonas sp.]|uniref:DUF4139 domain-containing protein n=1 Tax=Sphingomonas sp. TaxID=28214 RepID=UPI001D24586C|nr:DUF4139 domain-containing protein [Sphingomonas sp.]MBX9797646.1 DUF4139 domain-containing protein [Sphingomonas sp.]